MESRWRIWSGFADSWRDPLRHFERSRRGYDSKEEAETQAQRMRERPWHEEVVVLQEGTYPAPDDHGDSIWLRLQTDTSVGDWAVQAVGDQFWVVPPAFSDYARIFHPAWRGEPVVRFGLETVASHEVRWAEVAAANGKVAHPLMDWASITGHWRYHWGNGTQPGLWDRSPEDGSLSERQLRDLARVLAPYTETPERCFFGVWEGYGDVRAEWPDAPRLPMPAQRDMILLTGPLSAATTGFVYHEFFGRSPSMWWPEDRAWCVGTDVDDRGSYVGGSQACIEAVITEPLLEAMRLTADEALGGPDQINPEPEGIYPYG